MLQHDTTILHTVCDLQNQKNIVQLHDIVMQRSQPKSEKHLQKIFYNVFLHYKTSKKNSGNNMFYCFQVPSRNILIR
jgi:hypothetical protein